MGASPQLRTRVGPWMMFSMGVLMLISLIGAHSPSQQVYNPSMSHYRDLLSIERRKLPRSKYAVEIPECVITIGPMDDGDVSDSPKIRDVAETLIQRRLRETPWPSDTKYESAWLEGVDTILLINERGYVMIDGGIAMFSASSEEEVPSWNALKSIINDELSSSLPQALVETGEFPTIKEAGVLFRTEAPLPTEVPVLTVSPTTSPTPKSTPPPTLAPTTPPTVAPTSPPTMPPTSSTMSPTSPPTSTPTIKLTDTPTKSPTSQPDLVPTSTPETSTTSSPTIEQPQSTSTPTSITPETTATSSPTIEHPQPTSTPTSSTPETTTTSSPTIEQPQSTAIPTSSPTRGVEGNGVSQPSASTVDQQAKPRENGGSAGVPVLVAAVTVGVALAMLIIMIIVRRRRRAARSYIETESCNIAPPEVGKGSRVEASSEAGSSSRFSRIVAALDAVVLPRGTTANSDMDHSQTSSDTEEFPPDFDNVEEVEPTIVPVGDIKRYHIHHHNAILENEMEGFEGWGNELPSDFSGEIV